MHGIVCITPIKHNNSRLQEVVSVPTERKRGTSYFYESGEKRSYQQISWLHISEYGFFSSKFLPLINMGRGNQLRIFVLEKKSVAFLPFSSFLSANTSSKNLGSMSWISVHMNSCHNKQQ